MVDAGNNTKQPVRIPTDQLFPAHVPIKLAILRHACVRRWLDPMSALRH